MYNARKKLAALNRNISCYIADQARLLKGEKMDYIMPCFWCRLGNLMFQLAACYAHGIRHNIPVHAEWDKNEDTKIFRYILGDLANMFTNCLPTRRVAYKERQYAYSPIPISATSGIIEGYFQSWKYFSDCEREIFRLYSPFIASKEPNTLGVCIRLGDYKYYADQFNLMKVDWLRTALTKFDLRNKKLVLFSDEPKLALPMLHQALGTDKMSIATYEGGAVVQMQRLTSMENLIISASSFHWWGAYLGRCEKVVAPAQWFVDKISDYQDIYLPHWIRL